MKKGHIMLESDLLLLSMAFLSVLLFVFLSTYKSLELWGAGHDTIQTFLARSKVFDASGSSFLCLARPCSATLYLGALVVTY